MTDKQYAKEYEIISSLFRQNLQVILIYFNQFCSKTLQLKHQNRIMFINAKVLFRFFDRYVQS